MARRLPKILVGKEGLPGVQPGLAAAKMASLMCTGRALIAGPEEAERGAKRRRLVQTELALEGKTHARLGISMSGKEGKRTGAAMQQFQLFACSTTRELFLRPDGVLIPKLDAHQHNDVCMYVNRTAAPARAHTRTDCSTTPEHWRSTNTTSHNL